MSFIASHVSTVSNQDQDPGVFRRENSFQDGGFRAAFGDYAVCTAPNTNNTTESRTKDCIAMLPTHNRSGSFKMMSLTSGRIVTRDQFKILPMPQSVIQTLNSWALREGKKITLSKVHVFDEMYLEIMSTNLTYHNSLPTPTLRTVLSIIRWGTNRRDHSLNRS